MNSELSIFHVILLPTLILLSDLGSMRTYLSKSIYRVLCFYAWHSAERDRKTIDSTHLYFLNVSLFRNKKEYHSSRYWFSGLLLYELLGKNTTEMSF